MNALKMLLSKKARKTAYNALSTEQQNKYDRAMDITGNNLSNFGTILGGTMSAMANIPGEEPNVLNSIVGGALSGIGGGPMGMLSGAIIDGLTGTARYQDYKTQQSYGIPDVTSKGFEPNAFMEEGGPIPFTKVQTEKGEVVLLPNGTLVDVLAIRPHSKEKKNKVTDMLSEGSYVFSHQLKLDTRKLSDDEDIIAQFPGMYSEQGNAPMAEMRLTDILGKGKMTFADAVKMLRKKIPTQEKTKDIFVEQANTMNKETRIPYLMKLIEMQEKRKAAKTPPKKGDILDVSEDELEDLKNQGYSVEVQHPQEQEDGSEED